MLMPARVELVVGYGVYLTGPAEPKLNWSGQVCNSVRKHAAARGSFDTKFDVLRLLLRPFLEPPSVNVVSITFSRLDSDSVWHVHVRGIYSLVRTWCIFLH